MFRFDVESYSLKYAKCQMIEMFTDEVAEQAGQNGDVYVYDTILQKQKFAVFRLCPTSSCSASKNFGCDNTYGEYLIDLSVYLQTMQEFNEQKKESYCQLCEECAAGNGRNQYNRKLDGAEEEVNYCTDSACTNYLNTCEEKEYDEYNELCDGFPSDSLMDRTNSAKKFDCEILVLDNYKYYRTLTFIFIAMHYDRNAPNSPQSLVLTD